MNTARAALLCTLFISLLPGAYAQEIGPAAGMLVTAREPLPVVFVVGWGGPTETVNGQKIEADGYVLDKAGQKWPSKTLDSYTVEIRDQATGTVLHSATLPATGPGKQESHISPELKLPDQMSVAAHVSACNGASPRACSTAVSSAAVTVEGEPVPGEVLTITISIKLN